MWFSLDLWEQLGKRYQHIYLNLQCNINICSGIWWATLSPHFGRILLILQLARHYTRDTTTPPQSPDAPFCESRFQHQNLLGYETQRRHCETINSQESRFRSELHIVGDHGWHPHFDTWMCVKSDTLLCHWLMEPSYERCDCKPGITLTPVLKSTLWHPEVWIYQNGI